MTAISSHLEKDLHRFRREKAQMESTLRTTANRMSRNLRRYYWSAVFHQHLKTMFADFVGMLESYKANYLAPNHKLWEKSAAIAAGRPGLNWMVLFKQPRLSAALNSWAKILKSQQGPALMVLSRIMREFRDRRPFSIRFPISDYSAVLTERNITLHTLVVSNSEDTGNATEKNFRLLSRLSGGRLMRLNDPGVAVGSLRTHGEVYTEIEALCKGGIEPKTIRITCADGTAIRHKQLFTSGELAALREQQSGVGFRDIQMIKNILTIEVGSYKRTREGTGIVTIQIELINPSQPGGRPIFFSKKTLRAHGETLAITLSIPPVPEGEWLAEITAYDLVANRSTRATYHPAASSRADLVSPFSLLQ